MQKYWYIAVLFRTKVIGTYLYAVIESIVTITAKDTIDMTTASVTVIPENKIDRKDC